MPALQSLYSILYYSLFTVLHFICYFFLKDFHILEIHGLLCACSIFFKLGLKQCQGRLLPLVSSVNLFDNHLQKILLLVIMVQVFCLYFNSTHFFLKLNFVDTKCIWTQNSCDFLKQNLMLHLIRLPLVNNMHTQKGSRQY